MMDLRNTVWYIPLMEGNAREHIKENVLERGGNISPWINDSVTHIITEEKSAQDGRTLTPQMFWYLADRSRVHLISHLADRAFLLDSQEELRRVLPEIEAAGNRMKSLSASWSSCLLEGLLERALREDRNQLKALLLEYMKERKDEEYLPEEEIFFGGYSWKPVCLLEDSVILLCSEFACFREYSREVEPVTWASSSLRSWLNEDWVQTVFSEEEKEQMLSVVLENRDNRAYGVSGGEATEDFVFLPSVQEIRSWFLTDRERILEHTFWWLRSPGQRDTYAACTDTAGAVQTAGHIGSSRFGIRPCIRVRLDRSYER